MTPGIPRTRLLALAVFLLTLALYWPARGFDFVDVDDPVFVTENEAVQQGLTVPGIRQVFGEFRASNWVPLTFVSLMLDRSLFGPGPAGFHFTNILLHALNAALLTLLVHRLGARPALAALLALLFAAHPMRVESVAWVAERKDVLSTTFWLLTTLAWLAWVRDRRRRDYGLALLAFAAGLASKGMLVTLPVTLLILDWWPLRRAHSPARLVLEKLPFVALALGGAAITLLAQGSGTAVTTLEMLAPGARLANAVVGYATYPLRLAWPMDLAYFYPHPQFVPPHAGWSTTTVLGSAALLVATTIGCITLARRGLRFALAGWTWYLVTLLPVIGLVQVGLQATADRYTYVPHLGLLVMLICGANEVARRWPSSSRLLATLAVGAVGASALLTARELPHWRDSEALFGRAMAVTESNGVAMNALGAHHARSGRPQEARLLFEAAVRAQPRHAQAHANLGIVLAGLGEDALAAERLRQALAVLPADARARVALGNVLARQGQPAAAAEQYHAALLTAPRMWEAHFGLGQVARLRGDEVAAAGHFGRALALAPDQAMRARIEAMLR